MQTREFRWLLVIFGVALALRILAIEYAGFTTVRFGDASDYLSAAGSLCMSRTYPDRGTMPFMRAPGLPFFIVAVTLCHGWAIGLIKVALAVVDSFSAIILFLLAQEFFQDGQAGLFAAAIAAIDPFFLEQVTDVRTEALFMFLMLAANWLMVRAARDPGTPLLVWAGLCTGAAALVRPVGLVLAPLLAVALLWRHSPAGHESIRRISAFAVGVGLCLSPWVIRNELRYHELILVNNAGGYAFWRGTSPEMEHVLDARNPRAFSEASNEFERVISPGIACQIELETKTPEQESRAWYRLSLANLAQHPAAFGKRILRNAFMYWRPWLSPQGYSGTVVGVSGISISCLYACAVMGWNAFRKQSPRLGYWCAIAAILFWALQSPFQMTSRIRIPIADPFLIVFAAGFLAAMMGRRRAAFARGVR